MPLYAPFTRPIYRYWDAGGIGTVAAAVAVMAAVAAMELEIAEVAAETTVATALVAFLKEIASVFKAEKRNFSRDRR